MQHKDVRGYPQSQALYSMVGGSLVSRGLSVIIHGEIMVQWDTPAAPGEYSMPCKTKVHAMLNVYAQGQASRSRVSKMIPAVSSYKISNPHCRCGQTLFANPSASSFPILSIAVSGSRAQGQQTHHSLACGAHVSLCTPSTGRVEGKL